MKACQVGLARFVSVVVVTWVLVENRPQTGKAHPGHRASLEGGAQETVGECGSQFQQPLGTLEHRPFAGALWRKMNPWPQTH